MDYLDRLEPQYSDKETFHDYKPTHNLRPSWLIDAAEAADEAWRDYDTIIEDELFSMNIEYRAPRYDLVEQARELAEEAAEFYSQQYERWQAELAEQLEVAK